MLRPYSCRLQFLPKSIEHIKIATALDNDGKYDEAIAEYVKGIGYFQTALKCASRRSGARRSSAESRPPGHAVLPRAVLLGCELRRIRHRR